MRLILKVGKAIKQQISHVMQDGQVLSVIFGNKSWQVAIVTVVIEWWSRSHIAMLLSTFQNMLVWENITLNFHAQNFKILLFPNTYTTLIYSYPNIILDPPSIVFFQLISWMVTLSSCLILQIISFILPLNNILRHYF